MNEALSLLIEAHSRWLRRHGDVDAEEFLAHYDALTCLWRQYHHMAEQGKRADELWAEEMLAPPSREGAALLEKWVAPGARAVTAADLQHLREHVWADQLAHLDADAALDTDDRDRDWYESARDAFEGRE